MNLKKIQFKNEFKTHYLLLSITKKCETLFHRTHTKPQETLEINLIKQRETFSYKPSFILGLDSNWMIGSTCLEVYFSVFNYF